MNEFSRKKIAIEMAQKVCGGSAMAQAMKTSDIRWERVAELRALIAGGQYNVSSDQVAGKLMEAMLHKGTCGAAFPV